MFSFFLKKNTELLKHGKYICRHTILDHEYTNNGQLTAH